MGKTDVIAFLSLVVALSAYIATIRLRLIDRIGAASTTVEKNRLREIALGLTFADAPLIVAGTFLFFYAFWDVTLGKLCEGDAPAWLQDWAVYLFTFAGIVLIAHHIGAWWKSVG